MYRLEQVWLAITMKPLEMAIAAYKKRFDKELRLYIKANNRFMNQNLLELISCIYVFIRLEIT